jgi:hypothetical protein
MERFRPGQLVRFTYHGDRSMAKVAGEQFKEILVLHPNWQGKLHAIDLKRLTMAERQVLAAIFDEKTDKTKPHHFPLVNDILKRMNPIEEIKNPVSFYTKFVKVFLRNKDAYRTYYPHRILHATIVKKTSVTGRVFNPQPLFHKVETKAKEPTEKLSPQQRIELMKKRMAIVKARKE